MTDSLIEPTSDDEILDADPDALQFNAVITGDVFASVAVGGEPAPATVMVAGHPCTIRGAHGAFDHALHAYASLTTSAFPTGYGRPVIATSSQSRYLRGLARWRLTCRSG